MQKIRSKKLIALLASISIFSLIYIALLFTSIVKSNDFEPVQSDAILVLGYSLEDDHPSPFLEQRLETALDLYNEGYAKNIIVSGGIGPTDTLPVAVIMKKWFIEKGVPSQFIITENYANNTYENFVYSKEICEEKGFDSVIVVTNDFHMYRSMITANEFFDNVSGQEAETHFGIHKLFMTLKEPLSIMKYELINKGSSDKILSTKDEILNIDKKYNQVSKSNIPSYDINIEYKTPENKFYVTENITFTNTSNQPINTIKMNLYHNRLKSITNSDTDYINISAITHDNAPLTFTNNSTYLEINVPEIAPNSSFTFTLNFDFSIPVVPYMTGSDGTNFWAIDFLPVLSEFKDGEFIQNEYSIQSGYNTMSNYEVTFVTNSELSVILPGKTTTKNDGITKTTIMEPTLLRNLSFAICKDFKKTSVQTDDNITLSFYHTSDNSAIYHLSNLAKVGIDYMCKNIGLYPYSEINIIEIEANEPYVYSSSNFIFVDKDYMSNPNVKPKILTAIINQWFGNIVYSNPPNDFVMSGLSKLISSEIFNYNQTNEEYFTTEYNLLLKQYDIINEESLSSENSSVDKLNSFYIKQIKSMLMFLDLQNNMGDNWQSFLSLLYNVYSFDNVNIEDLKLIATEFTTTDLDTFFDNWLNNDQIITQGGIE